MITASEYQDASRFLIYFDQKQRLALKKISQLATRKVKIKLTNINLELEIKFQPQDTYSKDSKNIKSRFVLVQTIVNQLWRVWHRWYFPTLLLRQKWHEEKRNLAIGDVCLLKDLNSIRGEWRICQVSNVFPDQKGKFVMLKLLSNPNNLILVHIWLPNL